MTVKDPQTGNPTTEHIVKEGPTGLIFTTTQATVHHENETRLLSLNTDDSNEQTSRVMMQLASEAVNDVHLDRWHDLQHWLADDADREAGDDPVRERPRSAGAAGGGTDAPRLRRRPGAGPHPRCAAPTQPVP